MSVLSEQQIGKVEAIPEGWKKGLLCAVVALLVCAVISTITVLLFNFYFMPGLIIALAIGYFCTTCRLALHVSAQEAQAALTAHRYTECHDGVWIKSGSLNWSIYQLQLKNEGAEVMIFGSRAVLKRLAKDLKK